MTDYQFALETRLEFHLIIFGLTILAFLLVMVGALVCVRKATTFSAIETILTTTWRQMLVIGFTTLLLAFLMERGWLLAIY